MFHHVIDGPALEKALAEAGSDGTGMSLAVAFWGAGSKNRLGLRGGADTRVLCNLTMGGTNPFEIRDMLDVGINVLQHPTLHAKIGFVGEAMSFVGSSNMSSNGLGLEGDELAGWQEANVLFKGLNPEVLQRFKALWKQGQEITKDDLEEAKRRWRARRTLGLKDKRPATALDISLVTAIRANDARLRSLPLVVAYYYEMKEKEKAVFNEALTMSPIKFRGKLTAFMDWEELPEGFMISVCRKRGKSTTLKDIEVALRRPEGMTFLDKDGTAFQVVEKMTNLPGFFELKNDELKGLKMLIGDYMEGQKKKESRIIPIADLMDFHAERGTDL